MQEGGLVDICEEYQFTATGGLQSIPSAKLPGTLCFFRCMDFFG